MGKTVKTKLLRMHPAEEYIPQLGAFRNGERVELSVDEAGLNFGAWSIPADKVTSAYWMTPKDEVIPLMAILRVLTANEAYVFSISPWHLRILDLPFVVEKTQFSMMGKRGKVVIFIIALLLLFLISYFAG